MTITKKNAVVLHMTQGCDWTMTVRFKNPNGTAKAMTGKSLKMGIVPNPGATPVILLTTANTKIVLTEATGIAVFTLKATDTLLLKQKRYEYDVIATDTTPHTDEEFSGTIEVEPQRTP